jgi:hypothetical protein
MAGPEGRTALPFVSACKRFPVARLSASSPSVQRAATLCVLHYVLALRGVLTGTQPTSNSRYREPPV